MHHSELVFSAIWSGMSTSIVGASHKRKGTECQDASLAIRHNQIPALILLVADGHGSPKHFRSATGAALAVRAGQHILNEIGPQEWSSLFSNVHNRELLFDHLARKLVALWRELVDQDIVTRPAQSAEEVEDAISSTISRLAYGTTLLGCCVGDDLNVLSISIGDGDILLHESGIEPRFLTRPPDTIIDSATESLCQPNAEFEVRCNVYTMQPATSKLVILSTDGLSNSFASIGDYIKVADDLIALVAAHGLDQLPISLPGTLSEISEVGSGDDISIAFAYSEALGEHTQQGYTASKEAESDNDME